MIPAPSIHIVGRLTADPTPILNGGIALRIAVNRRGKVGGEWQDVGTDFYGTALWGDDATAAAYLRKGALVTVTGVPEHRTYDSASGPRVAFDIARATVGIVPTARRQAAAPAVEADPWATDGADVAPW